MGRVLQRLGLPRKKSLPASARETERVQQAREDDRELIEPLDIQPLKFMDEVGGNLALPRRYGRPTRRVGGRSRAATL
jgi:hypothetical protein